MLVRILRLEPCRTEVAEVRVALKADHMVAAMGFLSWSSAGWARSSVQFEVFHRSLVLLRHLTVLGHWDAESELAVPALIASATECVRAVLTDAEEILSGAKFALAFLSVGISIALVGLNFFQSIRLTMLLRSRSALAPLARAVDCILVRLQICLVLQVDVSNDHLTFQRNLKQLAGAELGSRLPTFL